jgi:hypothetical protein
MAKALTFIFTLLAGSVIGMLTCPSHHDRAGGAIVGAILAIPVVVCALWIWQGADRAEDERWETREQKRANREM